MAIRARRIRSESRARYFIREQAARREWNTAHVERAGDFLEENEIERYFPDIGLAGELPDFLLCLGGQPCLVVEAKNDASKIDTAIEEACDYADKISDARKHTVLLAVGAAGEEDTGYRVAVRFKTRTGWRPLTANGAELTGFPSRREIELALFAGDSTTQVTVPDQSEFIDAAIELSIVLRQAKVEAPLRPKVIGAMVAAMYQGQINGFDSDPLTRVNDLMSAAINSAVDIDAAKKGDLIDALTLSGADFNRLSPFIARIVAILSRLNIRAVLQTDTDFLGLFYEAFLRYGYDNNALGIVFTPRHITRFCVSLSGISPNDRVIDIACGTGGFLVSAFDRMLSMAASNAQRAKIKSSIWGFDTNPTIWALATLNMFFRGDGKSHIEHGSCFDKDVRLEIFQKFTRAYLNPPFSQEDEPEYMFLDSAMDGLEPGGILTAVVYAGIFADDDHREWRKEFLRRHTLLGMVSLPEELFYPTAAPTSVVIAKAHIPHGTQPVFVARVWNDGYEKLKSRRVPRGGQQLTEVADLFQQFLGSKSASSEICATIKGENLLSGGEWSPQQWLPQPVPSEADLRKAQEDVLLSVFRAVAQYPELASQVLTDFGDEWKTSLGDLPTAKSAPLSYFFEIANGRSSGEKNYSEGDAPYISSGDSTNSIVGLVAGPTIEQFPQGGISITAFGQASLQPWPFFARGNGGSAVRVLLPKFNMSVRELIWFAAQINLHRWRFFYARMAIKSRLSEGNFQVKSPDKRIGDQNRTLRERIQSFRTEFSKQSQLW